MYGTLLFQSFGCLQIDVDVVFSTVKFTTAVSVFRNSGLDEKAEQFQNLDHNI